MSISIMTFGSLFAGIGGFDLGFERAGLQCAWQVEIDPYCQRVLAKHWPNVPRHDEIKTFPPPEGDWSVDVICGGFPCQDISNAGKRAGIDGDRSGLWSEMLRVIRVVRPRYVVVENVAALLGRGMDRVLSDLAERGFDAEWEVLAASDFGAPHIRERAFILAYVDGEHGGAWGARRSFGSIPRLPISGFSRQPANAVATGIGHWATEPELVRLVHGVPPAVDRLRGLGNAVVPQVAEWIGRRIIEASAQPNARLTGG